MAQTNQNVTISLTLPISCQICLGKVRQPVICCNHHVFCSVCMEVWLSKASQCPTCRVAITPDNPCREIIGATNDSDAPQSSTLKRRLRKSRGELLLKDYEDEIESLARENEELRNKNRAAETQPDTLLEPGVAVSVSRHEERGLDPSELQEWATKLRAATDLYEKVKQDVEKLKEANKTLRAQNVDLVQENMRLKAEVENRSPRKYGRYTVAAMEAKIQQHERDVAHLKRALERSDQYIEELEAQRDRLANPSAGDANAAGPKESARASEGTCNREESATGRPMGYRITTMRRSLSEMEETCVHTDLDGMPSGFRGGNQGLLLTTSEKLLENAATPHKPSAEVGGGDIDVCPSSSTIGFASPTTPSSAIRSLSLRSPLVQSEGRVGRGCGQGRGPLSYLRRLSFDGCGTTTSATPTPSEQNNAASKTNLRELPWMTAQSFRGANTTAESPDVTHCGTDTQASASSEAYMDAAYQEKMSELDSLISDGEGPSGTSSGPASQPAAVTEREPGSSDRTDTCGTEATSRRGVDDGKESGQRMTEGAAATTMTSAGLRSSSSSSLSSSALLSSSFSSSSAPSSSVIAAQVVQVTKRGCPSGPLASSPSKLCRRS